MRLFLTSWLVAISTPVVALDFAAIEAMVMAAKIKPAEQLTDTASCNTSSTDHASKSLPSDFEFCQPDQQRKLTKNGLYLSVNGDTKPLPIQSGREASDSKVTVPLPVHDDVALDPVSPFVLDLE